MHALNIFRGSTNVYRKFNSNPIIIKDILVTGRQMDIGQMHNVLGRVDIGCFFCNDSDLLNDKLVLTQLATLVRFFLFLLYQLQTTKEREDFSRSWFQCVQDQ